LATKTLKYSARINLNHPSLEGHFPGQPIVPGVVILDEMVKAFRRNRGHPCKIKKILSVKFILPLEPGARIEFVFDISNYLVRFTGKCSEKNIVLGQLEYSIEP
jgi:3-hydroxyacyl-[acyl-carrier-protein] dehydratase